MTSFFVPSRKNRTQVWVAALVLLLAALVLPQLAWADHASDHPESQFDSSSSISPSEAYAAQDAVYLAANPEIMAYRRYVSAQQEVAAAADSARWVAQGKYYTSERAAAADSARWAAQGKYYVEESERAAASSSARWVAQGKYYTSERAAAADSARWAALGSSHAAENAVNLAENPEIMAFRRYVAAQQEAAAAANSARWVALGAYYTDRGATFLAANPEIMAYRRYVASDQIDAAFLAANPEVMTYRRFVLNGCSETGQVC